MVLSSSTIVAALVSTGIISLAPNIILLLFPSYAAGDGEKSPLLSLGQAMAAGGLMGDVFLHTLQHHHQHERDHHDGSTLNSSEMAGLTVLVGFTLFFAADLMIRSLSHHHHHHERHHDQRHNRRKEEDVQQGSTTDQISIEKTSSGRQPTTESANFATTTTTTTTAMSDHANHNDDDKDDDVVFAAEIVVHRSTILLNLAADALHNFTDGLAIGASYALQQQQHQLYEHTNPSWMVWLTSRGGLASLSILFHEVPHELGDFCTLVRAGYSTRQAFQAQLWTALAAFCGTIVALTVASTAGQDPWMSDTLIFITAGGFIYLAATTILPDVLEDQQSNSSFAFRMAQLMAFAMGIGLLYMVSWLEVDDDDDQQQQHAKHHDQSKVQLREQHNEL